jgi:hypothetical protein
MRNVSDKSCTENQNKYFVFNIFFLNRAVDEITWKHVVEWGRLQMAMLRMSVTCWIPKTTNTHAQYVILIVFPLQQWSQERASL